MSIRVHPWLKHWLLPGLILGYLWFTLVNHLRVEWSVNPQYGYGWAVPFLCLYLIYLRSQNSGVRSREPEGGRETAAVQCVASHAAIQNSKLKTQNWLLFGFAFVWLPIRLVQEANPEWRLVSWALALIVSSLTLLLIQRMGDRASSSGIDAGNSKFKIQNSKSGSSSAFPILFFLVAVPWPTVIEGPLIQALTGANAACAIELLNLSGIPAVQHGNLIEVGSGVVGIDEACSGIRSFQASLMISLFFGELYRLRAGQRILFVVAGFGLAFVFNVGRTTLLTWVAARNGVAAIDRWHDTAGVTILVACFITLYLLALILSRRNHTRPISGGDAFHSVPDSALAPETSAINGPDVQAVPPIFPTSFARTGREGACGADQGESAESSPRPSSPCNLQPSTFSVRPSFLWLLAAWFLLSEIAVEGWYRWHESRIPGGATWTIAWPANNPTFKPLPFTEKTRQFLRQDEGANASWTESDGTRWQVIFLRWNPGTIAVHLAKSHTPQACLPASGRQIVSTSDVRMMKMGGLAMPFRHYVANDANRTLHVFYCLWEDRGTQQDIRPAGLTLRNRLEPVLAGRRNLGQRSVELAVWGIDDPAQAEAALRIQLEKLIRVEK